MRNRSNRPISETDLIDPTLTILAAQRDGFMSTSNLINELSELLQPKGDDLELLDGRNDTRFSQKVRNMVSHKNSPNNIIGLGYAEYDEERSGLVITAEGRAKI